MHPLPYPLSAMDKVSTDAEEEFVIFPSNTSGEAVGGWQTFSKKRDLEISKCSRKRQSFHEFEFMILV